MTQKRKRYDKQFKIAAARVVLGGEMRAVDLARELGIKDSTLRRWAQEYEEMGENAFPGNGSPKVNKDYEIVKLRKRIEETRARERAAKKFPGLLESRPCVRCEFLKEHRGEFGPIRKACGILRVSKSEYYDYVKRRKSNAQIEREALEGFVAERFDLHKGRYGYRRINRELRRDGIVVSEKRVLAVMRKLGLQAKGASRKHKRAKAVEMGDPRVNLVDRAFDVEARNKLWVGDITYIGTGEGWLYLAAVIDAFHRKVVGWSMSERMTEKLVTDALEQAVGRESPPDDFSLVFHDDQGSQYTSRAFQRCLESHGIAQSMSRPGNPWDNALAESFFKTLKRELVNGKGYKTREEAKQDVLKYIELYYNRQRMHSSIGYNAPCDLERDVA